MMMCLGVFLLWVQFLWDSLGFLDFLEVYFLHQIREVFLCYLFKWVFNFLLLFFSFWHPYNSDFGTFLVVSEIPQHLFIFLNSCFFILFWLDVYFFVFFQIVAFIPGFLPVTVGSLNILLYFTLGIFHSFFHFLTKLSQFCEHFDYQGFKFSIR